MSKVVKRVTLQCTDLTGAKSGCTTLGSNKFWKGEVVDHEDGTADFTCLWGSTGEAGSTKGSKYKVPLAEALKTFATKVAEKTSPKKGYVEIAVRDDHEEKAKAAAKGVTVAPVDPAKVAAAPAPARHFARPVASLLSRIYGSTASTVTAGLSSQSGSTADNPIGNLSDAQLDKGGDVLDKIGALLESRLGAEDPANRGNTLPLVRGVPDAAILDLTNEYLSSVPRAIDRSMRGRSNLHRLVISSYERLQEQREFLQLLRDAHLSADAFKAAAQTTTADSREGVWYDGLGCTIEVLSPSDNDYAFVKRVFETSQSKHNANWWRNGRSRLRLVNVFRFERNGVASAFEAYQKRVTAKPGATGTIYAWHGTRTPNLLGISKAGLLMPENLPRGVHISGKAFGRGIYHAPVSYLRQTIGGVRTDGTNGALKSMNYTGAGGAYYGGNDNDNVFLYLQEVALGTCEVRRTPCWDQRRPAGWPNNDFTFAAASECSSLTHDEIVTYSEDAQVFRYLCEIGVD